MHWTRKPVLRILYTMDITRRTIKRKITEEEALRLKEQEPFATFRQDSKSINFSFIFGASFKSFSTLTLETAWSYERVHAFIKEKSLKDIVDNMAEKYATIDTKLWEYYAAAYYIREQFFYAYKGLMERIKRNEAFAKENGYIRSFHGAIRRLPLLSLCMHETEKDFGGGKQTVIRMRPNEDIREIAGLVNISSNSTIQSDENITMMLRFIEWESPDNPYRDKVIIIGFVHDSLDAYVEKEGAVETIKALKACFEKQDDWQKGVAFPTDCTVVDISKGEYYKRGTKFKKFCELHKGS
jgi:hypothetical protein